ncbi:TetR/AcrR family transcriptional regulator [Streptomyces hoynatensis]|uniref:TetR/AcrR family transcriptional regulator n=1 Tax=Streptomyces hoynatensis TaxID=1141874 RepID=A0A3A9ZFN2_9ACTN|nr:TetR/AcrR family transcriptional regulator [Streptomyces hoynatensis]RKN47148.1 TetR/AcrR family transcriptional regulator [Streptomyces hoynatensis]
MPTARDSLLDAALRAVERRPWQLVRMVEVAADAGVSRQTLYNEFGDKAGLGAALATRQLTAFLDGFAARLREGGTLEAACDWLGAAAREDPLVHAALTGCHCRGLPPATRQPGELVAELRDRARRALTGRTAAECETAVRLALSLLVAPPPAEPALGSRSPV